ncbi:MAG: RDD family protein [Propionibacteriaceae bacterium]|nr:RDD family protein [Propionibacteriaceae bacterium]
MIPRGHEVAGLGRRFLAYLIDVAPVALFGGLLTLALSLWGHNPAVVLVASITTAVLTLAYGLYQWWAYATSGAGIGAKAMKLELVGLLDGKPIGWWRVFLRFLVYLGLMITVVGGIAFLVFLIIHERRQGWHDMAVKAVLVQPKAADAPARAQTRSSRAQKSTVGLPPHLAEAFSPEASNYANDAWAPNNDWQQEKAPEQEPWRAPDAPWAQEQQPAWGGQQYSGQPSQPQQQMSPQPGAYAQSQASANSFQSPAQPGPQSMPSASGSSFQPADHGQPPRRDLGQAPASQQSAPPAPPAMPPSTANPPGTDSGRRAARPEWIPMPTPTSVLEPSKRSVRVRQREFGDVEEDEGTTIAALPHNADAGRPGDEGWYIRLDDGREVELTVTVLLGRNPQRAESDPEVQLVPAMGDGRMISRTHVLIGTDPRGVFVIDRGSTNGTALMTPNGEYDPAPSGVQVRVRDGQQVNYGNRWFTVLRRPVL